MVSEEVEYIAHLANEDLERFSESLSLCKRHHDDIFECSVDGYNDGTVSLTKMYSVIDERGRSPHFRGISDSQRSQMKQKVQFRARSQHSDFNDNHTRASRNDEKFVQQSHSSNHRVYDKCQQCNENSASKKKMSTFWDYDGHKRTQMISKSMCDIEKLERSTGRCCTQKDFYNRQEIMEYIRDKRRLFEENQCLSNLNENLHEERGNMSLIKLNNYSRNEFEIIEVHHNDYFCHKLDKGRQTPDSFSDHQTWTKHKPIYDELDREGLFNKPVPTQSVQLRKKSQCKLKHGSSNFGLETGDRLIRGTMKTRDDPGYDRVSSALRREKKQKENLRQMPPIYRKDKRPSDDKPYTESRDHMSAYDVGSDHEMGNDMKRAHLLSPQSRSPILSHRIISQRPDQSINSLKTVISHDNEIRSHETKERREICKENPIITISNSRDNLSCWSPINHLYRSPVSSDSSRMCLVDELKEALLDAQIKLNSDLFGPKDTLSERISRAVQNFVKKSQEHTNVSLHSINGDFELVSKEQKYNVERMEYSEKKDENKKECLSTEYEATDIEYEHCKQEMKSTEDNPSSIVKHEIGENKSEIVVDQRKDILTRTLELVNRKQSIQSRRDKTNENIRLIRDIKNGSRKMKPHEKKAGQVQGKKTGLQQSAKPDAEDSVERRILELRPTRNTEDTSLPKMSRQCRSIVSEDYQKTASSSDPSCTLSDNSELQVRLVALRTEISKKQRLVSMLKSHQKGMKREKIKQKEIILEKQIDMYDTYISKLQGNIHQIETHIHGTENYDSDTSTELLSNINDHGRRMVEGEDNMPMVTIEMSSAVNNVFEVKECNTEDLCTECCRCTAGITGVSLNLIMENDVNVTDGFFDLDMVCDVAKFDNSLSIGTSKIFHDMSSTGMSGGITRDRKSSEELPPLSGAIKSMSGEVFERNNTHYGLLCEPYPKDLCLNEYDFFGEICNGLVILNELRSKRIECVLPGCEFFYPIIIRNVPRTNDVDRRFAAAQFEYGVKEVQNQKTQKECVEEIEEFDVRLHVLDSDDDASSISDAISVELVAKELPLSQAVRPTTQSGGDSANSLYDGMSISTPCEKTRAFVTSPELGVPWSTEFCSANDTVNSGAVERALDDLFNSIVGSEIEWAKQLTAQIDVHKPLSAPETVNNQCPSVLEPFIPMVSSTNTEKLRFSTVSSPEELWEFTDVTLEEPSGNKNMFTSSTEHPAKVDYEADSISVIDKQLLSDKIKWLIPLKPDYLDTYVDSAICHFFQATRNKSGTIEDSLVAASRHLPAVYTETMSVVTDFEVGDAIFDSSRQHCYIDRRIVFQLVKEMFSEIYSFERYLPQRPWMQVSLMIKRKTYTTWNGDRPPDSYDLVSEIVHERLNQLFNPNKVFLEGSITGKKSANSSHSKILRWCIEKQKDQIDKILINEVRVEENLWTYFDEAEEEVKIQIAEDIFNVIVTDTTGWLRSIWSGDGLR